MSVISHREDDGTYSCSRIITLQAQRDHKNSTVTKQSAEIAEELRQLKCSHSDGRLPKGPTVTAQFQERGTINRGMQLVKESACLISKIISLPQRNYWQKQKASLQKLPDKIPTSRGGTGDLHKPGAYQPSCAEHHSKLCVCQAPNTHKNTSGLGAHLNLETHQKQARKRSLSSEICSAPS